MPKNKLPEIEIDCDLPDDPQPATLDAPEISILRILRAAATHAARQQGRDQPFTTVTQRQLDDLLAINCSMMLYAHRRGEFQQFWGSADNCEFEVPVDAAVAWLEDPESGVQYSIFPETVKFVRLVEQIEELRRESQRQLTAMEHSLADARRTLIAYYNDRLAARERDAAQRDRAQAEANRRAQEAARSTPRWKERAIRRGQEEALATDA